MNEAVPRILIVEDEESLADSVRYNLEREGFDVAVVTDGRRAIERFKDFAPALVILDLMLTEMSGLDVCRLIRQGHRPRAGSRRLRHEALLGA